MKKMFLLMKNMMRLFLKNKILVTQLTILMIVSTIVITTTTVTIQRLDKSQNDINKISIISDYTVADSNEDYLDFNDVAISDQLVEHNNEITYLNVYNKNNLNNNYINIVDLDAPNPDLFWPTNDNNEIINLVGDVSWEQLTQLNLSTVFWFEQKTHEDEKKADSYDDLVFKKTENNQSQLLGTQKLNFGSKIIFDSPSIINNFNNYEDEININVAIVDKSAPFLESYDFKKNNLPFVPKPYFNEPFVIKHLSTKTRKITKPNETIVGDYFFEEYNKTFSKLINHIESNTIQQPFYGVNLKINTKDMSNRYKLFANYLLNYKNNKNFYLNEIKIEDPLKKYNDLFNNQVLIPKEIIENKSHFEDVRNIINNAKKLLSAKIKNEVDAFFSFSQNEFIKNQNSIKKHEYSANEIKERLKLADNNKRKDLEDELKVIYALIEEKKLHKFMYDDLINSDFRSILNKYDVLYKNHRSIIQDDVKTNRKFILTDASTPTFKKGGVIVNKSERINNPIQIINESSQFAKQKYNRIYIDEINNNQVDNFEVLHNNFLNFKSSIIESYENDPTNDLQIPASERDYSKYFEPNQILVYDFIKYFDILFNHADWILFQEFLKSVYKVKNFLFDQLKPFENQEYYFNLNANNKLEINDSLVALYKDYDDKNNHTIYSFNGYVAANNLAAIKIEKTNNLPNRLQLINIIKKDDFIANQSNYELNLNQEFVDSYASVINFQKGIKNFNSPSSQDLVDWSNQQQDDWNYFKKALNDFLINYIFLTFEKNSYGFSLSANYFVSSGVTIPFNVNIINKNANLAFISSSYIQNNKSNNETITNNRFVGDINEFKKAAQLPYKLNNDQPPYKEIIDANNQIKKIPKDYYSWLKYVVDDDKKVELHGIFYYIIAAADSSDFLFPAINENDIIVDKNKTAVLFLNTAGYEKIKDVANAQDELNYYSIKINNPNFDPFIKENTYKKIKSELQLLKKGNIYKNNSENPFGLQVKRTVFLTQIKTIVVIVALTLIGLTFLLAVYFVVSSLKNMINKNKIMFGSLQAQGVNRLNVWLSFIPFYTIPSLIVLIIGYPVAYILQRFVMKLFTAYWIVPIPTEYVSVGWIFAIPLITTLILGVICFILIFLMLRKPTAETIKGDAGFKINKFVIATKKLLLKFGAISVLRGTYVVANLARMVILAIITASFSIISAILATTKDNFSESSTITNNSRLYKFATDLYSPTEQGGLYYISKFDRLGTRNELSPFKEINKNVLININLESAINKKVLISYLDQNKQRHNIQTIIDQDGRIIFEISLLPKNNIYYLIGVFDLETNALLINKNDVNDDLKIIDFLNLGWWTKINNKQVIAFNHKNFKTTHNLIAKFKDKSTNEFVNLRANFNNELVYFDVNELDNVSTIYELQAIYSDNNIIVHNQHLNNKIKTYYSKQNGRYVYNSLQKTNTIYFKDLDSKYFNKELYLTYLFNKTKHVNVFGVVDSNGYVSFDLSELDINYDYTNYELLLLRDKESNHIIYDIKNNDFSNHVAVFNNFKYGHYDEKQKVISFDYLTNKRKIELTIEASAQINDDSINNKKTFTKLVNIADPQLAYLDYNELDVGYVYQIKKANIINQTNNIYLNNSTIIDKLKDNSLPYSSIEFNNALKVIENLGTNQPYYGDSLGNIYYPSVSTQPEIHQNIHFFNSKIISKSSLDGNIKINTGNLNLEFNPWVFAKTFLPSSVIAKAELNEKALIEESFKVFGYENVNQPKLFDVPDFENKTIIRQISLWTITGKPPKSKNDPDSFFIFENDEWKINERPGVLTKQGAAEFVPEFIRLITQMYSHPQTNKIQYKAGLNLVNIDDDNMQQTYTYIKGKAINKNDVPLKIVGINYDKNKLVNNNVQESAQLKLLDKNNNNLMDLIQNDDFKQDFYNIIINEVVSKKYNLKINDYIELEIDNHIKRFSNQWNNNNKIYKAKFKVVGIAHSLMDEQLIINQKIANHLLGYYDYQKRIKTQNGFNIVDQRLFNGFFTKEIQPIFFNNLASFYSPSGLNPAIGAWPQNILSNPSFKVSASSIRWIFFYNWDEANSTLSAKFSLDNKDWKNYSFNNLEEILNKIGKIFGVAPNLPSFVDVDANIENEIFSKTLDNTIFLVLLNVISALIPSLLIIIILIASTLANESIKLIAIMKILGLKDFKNINNFMFIYPIVWFINIIISTPLTYGFMSIYKLAIFKAFNIILVATIPWWIFVVTYGIVGLVLLSAWLLTFKKTQTLNLPKMLNQLR